MTGTIDLCVSAIARSFDSGSHPIWWLTQLQSSRSKRRRAIETSEEGSAPIRASASDGTYARAGRVAKNALIRPRSGLMYLIVTDSGLIRRTMHWSRFVALLLALVFAPGSVFGAMPLVWCIGSDGHRAVEYSVDKRHTAKHVDHQVLGQQLSPDDVSEAQHHDGNCRDWQILDTSAKSQPQSPDGLLSFDIRVFVALPTLSLVEPAAVAVSNYRSCADYRCLDPPFAALRSVVLRI